MSFRVLETVPAVIGLKIELQGLAIALSNPDYPAGCQTLVRVLVDGHKVGCTTAVEGGMNPKWDEVLEFSCAPRRAKEILEKREQRILKFEVVHKKFMLFNGNPIVTCSIPLRSTEGVGEYNLENSGILKVEIKVLEQEYFLHKIPNGSGGETTTTSIGTEVKTESARTLLRDQEDRIRQDYAMYRGLIQEENSLIVARMTSFTTLQGFLWAAAAFSINRTSPATLQLVSRFLEVLASVGMVVVVASNVNMAVAANAITQHVVRWDAIKRLHEQATGITYTGPDLVGARCSIAPLPTWIRPIPIAFFIGWGFILKIAFDLKRGDLLEIGSESCSEAPTPAVSNGTDI